MGETALEFVDHDELRWAVQQSDRVLPLEIVLLLQIKQILLELKVAVAERFDERFEHVG